MQHADNVSSNYRHMLVCILHNAGGTSGKDTGKENILFSALAKFMKKSALSSLSEIERYIYQRGV